MENGEQSPEFVLEHLLLPGAGHGVQEGKEW